MHVGQEKDQGNNVILLTTDQILLPSVLKDVSGPAARFLGPGPGIVKTF